MPKLTKKERTNKYIKRNFSRNRRIHTAWSTFIPQEEQYIKRAYNKQKPPI